MGTTTGVVNKVNIFDPVIKVNGVDVGFISDKISLQYGFTSAKYESGLPKNLRKVVKSEEFMSIKCDLMQSTIGNFQSAMNLPSSSLVSTSIITAGGDPSMQLLTDVEFSGTDDRGKLFVVHFYKGVITEEGEWSIDQDFMKIPVTIMAVAQLDRSRGDQLGFILRETT